MTEAETQPPTTPTTTKINIVTIADDDFVEAAGLQRSEQSAKKSTVEKLLGKKLYSILLSNQCLLIVFFFFFQNSWKIQDFQEGSQWTNNVPETSIRYKKSLRDVFKTSCVFCIATKQRANGCFDPWKIYIINYSGIVT